MRIEYAERKLNEAIEQGEPETDVAYWRGYMDCARAVDRDAAHITQDCGKDTNVTTNADLLARAEAAEARAEKAERERDALLKEFAGECGMCLHYEDCAKNHNSCCDGADWEWKGHKEE